jgi:L-asparaginase
MDTVASYGSSIDKTLSIRLRGNADEMRNYSMDISPSRVVIITTGGTISGVHGQGGTVLVSSAKPNWKDSILRRRPNLERVCLEFDSCMNVFSENITPSDWAALAERVGEWVRRGCVGLVISHGTDTLPYTSAALSFMLANLPVAVVLTGAVRPLSDSCSDALDNLCDSIIVAAERSMRGVFVVFSSLVHYGTRVRKMASSGVAFESINNEPVGRVLEDRVELRDDAFFSGSADRAFVIDSKHDAAIAFFKVHPGFDPTWLTLAIERKKAILLELYVDSSACTLEGNAYNLIPALKVAKQRNVPVFATSQQKSVLDLTKYETGLALYDAGVMSLHDMTTEAALAKLMWVVGHVTQPQQIHEIMLKNLANEISEVNHP